MSSENGHSRLALVRAQKYPNFTTQEWDYCVAQAEYFGLDIGSNQIHFNKRSVKDGTRDKPVWRSVIQTTVGIDGFRLIAERSDKYAGQLGPHWTSDGSEWVDVWGKSSPPLASRCGVLRHDFKEPIWSTAHWTEYYSGSDGGGMSKRMPALMLAKCAEALALRRAFPKLLSGAYAPEEMLQAARPQEVEQQTEPERKTPDAAPDELVLTLADLVRTLIPEVADKTPEEIVRGVAKKRQAQPSTENLTAWIEEARQKVREMESSK